MSWLSNRRYLFGFFEVTRQGDLGMLPYDPRLAFDTLGPEIGAIAGETTRYRAFFVVDRGSIALGALAHIDPALAPRARTRWESAPSAPPWTR